MNYERISHELELVEVELLLVAADEVRREMATSKTAANFRLLKPLGLLIRRAFIKSANIIYKKLVEPHLDEIYDDEIEEDALAWCKKEEVDPCDPPREVLVDIVDDVKDELDKSLSQRYFVSAFKKAVQTINPVNIVKAAYFAIKNHGLKVGLKVAAIIILGDIIIPILGGMIHPSLFAILHATPHTEIGIAVLAVTEAVKTQEALAWVRKYEKMTGDDLVKEKAFA
jgi:hypothetical protein